MDCILLYFFVYATIFHGLIKFISLVCLYVLGQLEYYLQKIEVVNLLIMCTQVQLTRDLKPTNCQI